MDQGYTLAEIAKRIENIIRVGAVDQIDTSTAKVRVKSGDILTNWLPWLTRKAGNNSEWWAPEVGEQVLILSPGGDLAQGIVLPSLYQDAHPAQSDNKNVYRQDFSNGDYIQHDQDSGQLTIKAKKFRFIGPVEQTGGDMTSDGVSAQHHKHGGILAGPNSTDEPIK